MCEIKDKVINCCNCNETENLIKSINVYRYEDGKKYRIVRYDFTKDKEIKLYLYLTELHMMENHTLENYNKNIANNIMLALTTELKAGGWLPLAQEIAEKLEEFWITKKKFYFDIELEEGKFGIQAYRE